MKKIKDLRKPFKVSILVFLVSLLGFCATAFLIPTRIDVPLGIITSGILFALLNFLQGLAEKQDAKKAGTIFSIIAIIVKFVIVVTFIILSALMFYKWDLPYINIFAIVGVYTASIIATILVYILEKE